MKKDTKHQLIDAGMTLFLEQGFNHTGIQEVLQAVGVPKGSFYHFFKSKHDFGLQVLEYYGQDSTNFARQTLEEEGVAPLQRIRNFFEGGCHKSEEEGFKGGCLIGNLSQELADQCPVFAERLEQKWQSLQAMIAANIEEARAAGSLTTDTDANCLAGFILNGWQGTVMRAKLTKCCRPQDDFLEMVFDKILI